MAGLDVLRFAAAAMVTLFHLAAGPSMPTSVIGHVIGPSFTYPELVIFDFGWVGVEVFFVISGIVIASSAEQHSAAVFARSRVLRLAPAAWLCAPLSALAVLAYALVPPGDLGQRLAHALLFVPVGPWVDEVYWTLGVELVFYALVWTLLLFGRFDGLSGLAFGIGAMSAAYWIGGAFFRPKALFDYMWDRRLDLMLVHHGVFFALGIFIYLSRSRPTPWHFVIVLVGAAVVAIDARAEWHHRAFAHLPHTFLPVLVWLLALALAYAATRVPEKSGRFLATLGLATYPLYLLHYYCGVALMRWLGDYKLNRWIILITVIFIMVGGSVVIVRMERPLRRVLDFTLGACGLRQS
jgi:peptidoglycan/LPS O-acetylase OafA/YrhL